jgi:hypothetical protein
VNTAKRKLFRLVSVVGKSRRPIRCMTLLIENVPCQRRTVERK